MKLDFDSAPIAIPCPQCGKQLKEKIGRLKRDKHITCPACGRIAVDTDQLRRLEADIEKTMAKKFAQIGRQKITIKL